MSYTCNLHGWRHMLNPCPSCYTTVHQTSGTNIPEQQNYQYTTLAHIHQCPICGEKYSLDKITELEAKLAIAIEALQKTRNNEWLKKLVEISGYDFLSYLNEALKAIEEK